MATEYLHRRNPVPQVTPRNRSKLLPLRPCKAGTAPNSIVGFSDETGAFVLEGVPTGDVSVWCFPVTAYWSNGRVDLTLTGGQDATCEVPVVKSNPELPQPQLGAVIEPGAMPPRFQLIAPHGPAERAGIHAGDVIMTIDDANASRLTPWGAMIAIGQRPAGSTAHLGLSRGAQTTSANLVLAPQ